MYQFLQTPLGGLLAFLVIIPIIFFLMTPTINAVAGTRKATAFDGVVTGFTLVLTFIFVGFIGSFTAAGNFSFLAIVIGTFWAIAEVLLFRPVRERKRAALSQKH